MATQDMSDAKSDATRRDFLYIATGAVGVVGVAGVAWPLIDQMNPDKSVLALASIEVDLSAIPVGGGLTVKWRGQPVFIRNRPKADIDAMEKVAMSDLKDPELDSKRVKKGHANWLIMIGVCTHLGCIPEFDKGEFHDGWFCPCHGSQYDASGRIRHGPAPRNLVIPPYAFESDTKIKIG